MEKKGLIVLRGLGKVDGFIQIPLPTNAQVFNIMPLLCKSLFLVREESFRRKSELASQNVASIAPLSLEAVYHKLNPQISELVSQETSGFFSKGSLNLNRIYSEDVNGFYYFHYYVVNLIEKSFSYYYRNSDHMIFTSPLDPRTDIVFSSINGKEHRAKQTLIVRTIKTLQDIGFSFKPSSEEFILAETEVHLRTILGLQPEETLGSSFGQDRESFFHIRENEAVKVDNVIPFRGSSSVSEEIVENTDFLSSEDDARKTSAQYEKGSRKEVLLNSGSADKDSEKLRKKSGKSSQ
jgi:hypothetical protein